MMALQKVAWVGRGTFGAGVFVLGLGLGLSSVRSYRIPLHVKQHNDVIGSSFWHHLQT